jgi:O-antigen/teichoic acid export membrane protein
MKEQTSSRMRLWSLVEQGFLSLANFGMAVFLARELPKERWGAFSLGFALLLFAQGFQRALVSIPVATMARDRELLAKSLRFWRRLQTRITWSATALLAAAAGVTLAVSKTSSLGEALAVAALLVPGYFSLEFWRRMLIQCRDIKAAAAIASAAFLAVALTVALLHLLGGGALAAAAGLSACYLLAGAACRVRSQALLPEVQEHVDWSGEVAKFGRWSTLSHVAFSGYNTAIQLILSLVAGPAAMGSFAAIRNLTQPINTLIGAVDNLDKPRAARAFAADGFFGLFASLWRTFSTLGLIGGAYLLFCSCTGGYLVQLAYHGRYGHAWNEIWMWCLIAFAMMAVQPLESGLYVAQRTDALFTNRVVSALIGLCAALLAIPVWGVMGALLGLALGWISTGVLAAWQLYHFSRGSRQTAVLEVARG